MFYFSIYVFIICLSEDGLTREGRPVLFITKNTTFAYITLIYNTKKKAQMGRRKKAEELALANPNFDFDFSSLDLDLFEAPEQELELDEADSTRYMKPKMRPHFKEENIMYDHAIDLARELRVTEGMRANAFVSGNFIFGDFIEAFMTQHNVGVKHMTISTLSMSQNNVDSLRNLIDGGYIQGDINLVVSAYFYSMEIRALIPYIYDRLDVDNKFQLAVAGIHTKTVHFETLGGKKIVIHGSANLRSSANIEQFTIEENPELYDFYDEKYSLIIDKYKTINKEIRVKPLWDLITRKQFKD